ncbi:MAG TPA: phenylalanine--tRNA ligase subunit beta [Pirellulaceae bacterium]|nr:phenylalanine--tRNA ligase subunit beta [Pirellulaceae bacterium]
MLVSWNWLRQYIDLDVSPEELTRRLMMAGLNLESMDKVGSDLAIDLEVTSNRPDCLGHIGIAREAAVLFDRELKLPLPLGDGRGEGVAAKTGAPQVTELTRVTIQCPDLCPRYTARVIRGIKVKSSPAWLADRLRTIGQPVVSNVVDITNYVLMECGQPLHAFDFNKLAGKEIIVRRANAGEAFPAIDHKTYPLDDSMCVIADAQRAVALGGVMGGADTEVSPATTDLLIESAVFAPLSIRTTSRRLKLKSDSSYRFERGVDPEGIDWASRRCCELILELCGGQLAEGVIDVGQPPAQPAPIILRLSQLPRILGIEIPREQVRRILSALGCRETAADAESVTAVPPSWRRDLSREIDLIEEVARIHGYEAIPEDVGVPMTASHKTDQDRVLAKVRHVMTAAGFDEALTTSVVPEKWSQAFSPWTSETPLVAAPPMLKGADQLRRSLVPSLLEARRYNQSVGNEVAELFEIAKIYLPQGEGLPHEQWTLAAVSGQGFSNLKGTVEALLAGINSSSKLEVTDTRQELFDPAASVELRAGGKRLGFLGEISKAALKQFGLRQGACVVELDAGVLIEEAVLIPKSAPISTQPSISRDLNFIVDEALRWSDLAATVRAASGRELAQVQYLDTYRDEQKDGTGKKRLLLSLTLRDQERTLTSEEADAAAARVVAACGQAHGAVLLS